MDLEALETFALVMRLGSFAAAARQRQVDPSSVSRAIAGLEAELGLRLFQRTSRKFQPTVAGRAYFDDVAPLVEALRAAAGRATALGQAPAGHLRVTASVAFGSVVLAPLLGDFRQRFPGITLDLVLTDAVIDLLEAGIDVAIRLGQAPPGTGVRTRLMPTRYHVCASAAWLARHPALAGPADLSALECVRFPYAGFDRRWRFRARDGHEVAVDVSGGIVVSSALAVRECVRHGLGPGLLPDWLIAADLADGTLQQLFDDYRVTATGFDTAAWILYPSRTHLPHSTRVFVDFLRARIGAPRD